MIERLFQFFDDNPEVPQALIASEDGDVTRDGIAGYRYAWDCRACQAGPHGLRKHGRAAGHPLGSGGR